MADKSAFVPVDAIGNHKASDIDVDIDDELFGKKPSATNVAAPPPAPAPPAPVKAATPSPPPPAPAPAKPAPAPSAGKFTYKKATTYQKTYAGQKK